MLLIYSVVVLCATIIGATTGVGGGAIIKPVFDLVGADTAVMIGIYSSVAVFSMCITSIYKQWKKGVLIDKVIVLCLSFGAVLGGYVGELIFKSLTQQLSNQTVKMYQSLMLEIILIFVILYTLNKEKMPKYRLKNKMAIAGLSFLVGVISIFLGIGGGPLNIALLMICFSLSTKDAAIYSLTMIFFSQLSKIVLIAINLQTYAIDWTMCVVIVMLAFVGGVVGTKINQRFSTQVVDKMYIGLMMVLVAICTMNVLSAIS